MLGAIIGDIVGSRWEFNPTNDYDFELFSDENSYTDDTICTVAVADALLHNDNDFGKHIHDWCRKYPRTMGGYGGRFAQWVMSDDPRPYGSFGNGAAMRVSPIAWLLQDVHSQMIAAEMAAACSHNHPEGIKGAQAVVAAIHDCLEMHQLYEQIGQHEIMEHGLKRAINHFGYSIDIKLEDVQNRFDETCQGTVPVAFWIISRSESFEDAIRKAVSLGADADTLGAIVGSIAEAIWEIPAWMKEKAITYLPADMRDVLTAFQEVCPKKPTEKIAGEASGEEKTLIAFCGLDCEKCDAYIATKNDDQALREKTAKLWAELNNAPILPEHINCDGCRADGRKTFYCERLCGIRQCALKRGVTSCADCADMDGCQTLGEVLANSEEAQKNLKERKS